MLIRLVFLAAGLLCAAEIGSQADRLTVHEWGTFTSIANRDGVPQVWLPLSGPSDLPCFVHRFEGVQAKGALQGTVRMETPVLYFYSPRAMTATVHVDFQGILTEWYPRAKAEPSFYNPSRLEWNPLEISSQELPAPREPGTSHYYAARNTDALSVQSRGENDKLLFYRGVGSFDLPLRAALDPNGQLRVSENGSNELPFAIVFENRDGKVGYHTLLDLTGWKTVEWEQLTGSLPELRNELEANLVRNGLYPKEASAMLDTWGDSWFEEGARVFYIVPLSLVNKVLPLSITPQPVQTARVFMARLEILAPWIQDEIVAALRDGDTAVLAKYGRFLRSFVQQIGNTPHAATTEVWLHERYSAAALEATSKACHQ
jgi:hypothetical protein